jgi:hypothetical protein
VPDHCRGWFGRIGISTARLRAKYPQIFRLITVFLALMRSTQAQPLEVGTWDDDIRHTLVVVRIKADRRAGVVFAREVLAYYGTHRDCWGSEAKSPTDCSSPARGQLQLCRLAAERATGSCLEGGQRNTRRHYCRASGNAGKCSQENHFSRHRVPTSSGNSRRPTAARATAAAPARIGPYWVSPLRGANGALEIT